MPEPLLKCQKCGAVMIREAYHEYGWYLDGKKVKCCSLTAEHQEVEVRREDLRSMLAALEKADLPQRERQKYRRLLEALEGK